MFQQGESRFGGKTFYPRHDESGTAIGLPPQTDPDFNHPNVGKCSIHGVFGNSSQETSGILDLEEALLVGDHLDRGDRLCVRLQ